MRFTFMPLALLVLIASSTAVQAVTYHELNYASDYKAMKEDPFQFGSMRRKKMLQFLENDQRTQEKQELEQAIANNSTSWTQLGLYTGGGTGVVGTAGYGVYATEAGRNAASAAAGYAQGALSATYEGTKSVTSNAFDTAIEYGKDWRYSVPAAALMSGLGYYWYSGYMGDHVSRAYQFVKSKMPSFSSNNQAQNNNNQQQGYFGALKNHVWNHKKKYAAATATATAALIGADYYNNFCGGYLACPLSNAFNKIADFFTSKQKDKQQTGQNEQQQQADQNEQQAGQNEQQAGQSEQSAGQNEQQAGQNEQQAGQSEQQQKPATTATHTTTKNTSAKAASTTPKKSNTTPKKSGTTPKKSTNNQSTNNNVNTNNNVKTGNVHKPRAQAPSAKNAANANTNA